MADHDLSKLDKLRFFSELLKCGTNISLWQYSMDGHVVDTDSAFPVLDTIFTYTGNKDYMLDHTGKYTAPLIMGTDLGLMWCAVFDKENQGINSIYVLGPVLNSEISAHALEKSVHHYGIALSWREGYMNLMRNLPVVTSVLFFQYALMAHYAINGETLNQSDLHFQKRAVTSSVQTELSSKDRMQVWLAERALLNMVREGDLNFHGAINQANTLSNGIRSGSQNPLLKALISCTGFATLCTREAIQAGISPETAYSVGDSYIQSMVEANNISELSSINRAMYEDFIMRVHKHRTNPRVSPQIQTCRDYIELHTEQDLSLPALAKRVGYSEYHLSRKFKQEMGVSIRSYIRVARVERAKLLLVTTTLPISQIAEQLHFCSGSHFSTVFQEVVGQKPQQYRHDNQKM